MARVSAALRSAGRWVAMVMRMKRSRMNGAVRATRAASAGRRWTLMAAAAPRLPPAKPRKKALLQLFSTASAARSKRELAGRR